MACTTILVGKKASYDGSTMIARNDDSPSGAYMPKKFVVIHPEDQPKVYESVISHVKIELPENPMRYTAMPNAAGYISAEVRRPGRNCRWNWGRGHCIYRASLYPQRKRRRAETWKYSREIRYL